MIKRALPFVKSFKPNTIQKRWISNVLHINNFPLKYQPEGIYHLLRSYGEIIRLTTFSEGPKLTREPKNERDEIKVKNQSKQSEHERHPGQTVIVEFKSPSSAIMLKDELNLRPFTDTVTPEIIKTAPRDRPVLNVFYETKNLKRKVRPWVMKHFYDSQHKVKIWDSLAKRKH